MTKTQFLKTQHAQKFASIAASMDFEVAVDTAMLHFLVSTPDASDHSQAIAQAYQLEGARRLLRILKNIATPEQAATVEKWPEMVKT